jgi:hypothetical protein
MSKQKIGAGHAEAMMRLGLKELRNAANPSRESVADTEMGLVGTQTQGEIAEARGGPGHGAEQESWDKTMSLEELRDHAEKQRSRDDERDRGDDRGNERGGLER